MSKIKPNEIIMKKKKKLKEIDDVSCDFMLHTGPYLTCGLRHRPSAGRTLTEWITMRNGAQNGLSIPKRIDIAPGPTEEMSSTKKTWSPCHHRCGARPHHIDAEKAAQSPLLSYNAMILSIPSLACSKCTKTVKLIIFRPMFSQNCGFWFCRSKFSCF